MTAGRTGRPVLVALLFLLAANLALSWWNWRTVPSLAGYDEAMINDGAIGLARTGELRAPALEGTLLGSIYALHMPGYLLAQSAIFRQYGLNPWSLRASSKIPHILVCLLGLMILRTLWLRGVLRGTAAALTAVLWLTDIAGFWIGRQARMEPLEEGCGLAAAFLLLRAPSDRLSWLFAALLTGAAFCLHASAILFWLPLVIGLWMFRNTLGKPLAALYAALPLAVVALLWIMVHRERSLEAFTVFRLLNSWRTDTGFEWYRWGTLAASRFSTSSLATVNAVGGLSFWIVIAGWLLSWSRFRSAKRNRWLAFAIACTVAHALCAQFITGVLAQRLVLCYPFAILALGLTWTDLGDRAARLAIIPVALIALAQVGGMFFYVNAPGIREVSHFDSLPLAAAARNVAGSTELWYYFVRHGIPFRIITTEHPPYADYWLKQPEHFDDFDAVILHERDPLLKLPQLSSRRQIRFPDFRGNLVVCIK